MGVMYGFAVQPAAGTRPRVERATAAAAGMAVQAGSL